MNPRTWEIAIAMPRNARGDQLVALLNGDGAAAVAAEVLARPDGEEKAGDGDGGSQPE